MKTTCRSLVLSLPLLLAGVSRGQEDVAILLRRVPESSNALAVVRLDALLKSPRGMQESWADKYKLGYLNGAVRIPPSVKTVVMASHYHADDPARAITIAVALLNKKDRLSIQDVAAAEGGTIETVVGRPAVRTRRDTLVVELAPGLMGVMHPASRQELAGWIRFCERNREPAISPYLSRAASEGRGAPIQLALDLADIVDPKAVHACLPHCKALQGKPGPFEGLEELIKGLKGVRFTARVADSTTGEVYLDFSKPVGDNAEYMKELFLESLGEIGAYLDEFRDSKVRTENQGMTVVLRADLSDDTLRRIMSLIHMPVTDPEEAKLVTSSPGAKGSLVATESYYDAIEKMLNDLRRKNKKSEDKEQDSDEYAKSALWHQTYARRISELPRKDVDPEMLEYGADVAQKLDALSNSLRGIPLKVDLLQKQAYYYAYTPPIIYGRRWGYGFYGGYTDTNVPEIREKQTTAISQGQDDRNKIWQSLDEAKYKIRRRMSEKYQTNFDRPK
jgi:hypothetical protein